MSVTDKFIQQIDANKAGLIKRLADAVAIPSVSGDARYRQDVFRMADWLVKELEALGAKTELKPLGKQKLDGKEIDLPPVIFADYGTDPKKKTILVYGHFDVQPALKSDGWNTEPFELVHDEKTDRLYGRGSTDDKGPVLGWINVIEAHKQAGIELPVNLKFCLEGMEESGSEGLDDLIVAEKDKFFAGVDAACISDNYWLGTKKPCLTHGLRGISYFKLSISGPGSDLHSGIFGGIVHEPMTDLFHIMSSLVTPQGEILVPGIKELVDPLTDEERKRYEVMEFGVKDMNEATGSATTISDEKEGILMARMRYPSLSLHGVEGAFYEAGTKTVIPAKVIGKFSVRLVPSMTPDKVAELVIKHVQSEFKKLGSKNTMNIELANAGKPWLADPNHWNYAAAIKATEKVYGVKPDLTREGGSIPVALSFSEVLGKNLLLLPLGRADDGAHSTNEKLDLSNYVEGTKLLGVYLHEIAATA
ncbi:CNDP dipeptidase [Ceraceosorus guamensis]|uniref:CNDP dipeptidase n=1 Tax=Ceraceosorus guamensis TaxID=1522189 RepID=A0A316W2S3_9BASI|nr:CNDP dipeptidase [Ceraceosorus guamensis]PWN43398.1 CNDP dipeptidase [Ceraceosorus guamensis]